MTSYLKTGKGALDDLLAVEIELSEGQLEDLLTHLGSRRVRRSGNNLQSDHCFLHNNSSPTLGIQCEPPFKWGCFSCKAGGYGIKSLVAKAKGISQMDAQAFLCLRYSITIGKKGFSLVQRSKEVAPLKRFTLPRSALGAYQLDSEGSEACCAYLGVDPATASRFRIGYMAKKKRLVFPVFHANGDLGGLVTRSMRPDCPKELRWCNLDAESFKKEFVIMGEELPVDPSKPLVVVEGPRDFYSIRKFGWDNVRAILGSKASEWQLAYLASKGVPIVPVLDSDTAGCLGTLHMRRHLSKAGVKVWSYRYPEFPEGVKQDPGNLTASLFTDLAASFKPFLLSVPKRH